MTVCSRASSGGDRREPGAVHRQADHHEHLPCPAHFLVEARARYLDGVAYGSVRHVRCPSLEWMQTGVGPQTHRRRCGMVSPGADRPESAPVERETTSARYRALTPD